MDNGTLSAADVALLNRDGGFGDGWSGMIWLFAILALFGGGGFGFNGNGNLQADMQRGFDTQNLQAQTRDILTATNQSFHDSLAAMQGLYNETARDIAALAVGQANLAASQATCCCETKQLIMQSNYDAAMRDAVTNANISAQVQSVKDMIAQNKIEALQAQVAQLQLAQATSGMLKFPSSWAYEAGTFPPLTGTTGGTVGA